MKKHLAILYVSVTILLIFSCGSDSTPNFKPIYDKSLSSSDRIIAENAFAVFCDKCQPLMSKYSNDIESIQVEKGFDRGPDGCLDYRCREYGWDKQIYIKIKIKNDPSKIPGSIKARGHFLHFYLGGPKNSGYTVGKFPELCGARKTNNDYDVYVPEPKLALIK
ncbi:MAG: hypothetical protein ABFD76_13800 [Smithella sp.]